MSAATNRRKRPGAVKRQSRKDEIGGMLLGVGHEFHDARQAVKDYWAICALTTKSAAEAAAALHARYSAEVRLRDALGLVSLADHVLLAELLRAAAAGYWVDRRRSAA